MCKEERNIREALEAFLASRAGKRVEEVSVFTETKQEYSFKSRCKGGGTIETKVIKRERRNIVVKGE